MRLRKQRVASSDHKDDCALLTYIGPDLSGDIDYVGHYWDMKGERVPKIGTMPIHARIGKGHQHVWRFPVDVALNQLKARYEGRGMDAGKELPYWSVKWEPIPQPVTVVDGKAYKHEPDPWPELREMSESDLAKVAQAEGVNVLDNPPKLILVRRIKAFRLKKQEG